MVVAEAVAAMAATPAAIEVNLTIVFVLFVSADVILTRNSEMKAHTSKMDSYSSSIYMNVLPTSLAQTSYHLAPISHLKCLSVQFSSHIHYSYYYGASVLERCVFHRSRIRGARFIVPIPFIAFPRHKNVFSQCTYFRRIPLGCLQRCSCSFWPRKSQNQICFEPSLRGHLIFVL